MLNRIEVKGFQSLRDVDILLGRFTVILGESGTGKSALIRSMLKLARNDAVSGTSSGEDWSHLPPTTKNAEVVLHVDGHVVQWLKGKDNKYIIDGDSLVKVGKGCPDEVQDILLMREILFDGSDRYHLNFAQQFDMPFLLDDSGSKVAKILGEITNVNVLYAANREANKQKSSAVRTLSVREDDLETQKELLKQFVGLPTARKTLVELLQFRGSVDAAVVQYKERVAHSTQLSRLAQQTEDSRTRAEALSHMPTASKAVEGVFERLAARILMDSYGVALGACTATQTRLKAEARRFDPVRRVDLSVLDSSLAKYESMVVVENALAAQSSRTYRLQQSLAEEAKISGLNISVLKANVKRYKELAAALDVADSRSDAVGASSVNMAKAEEDVEVAKLAYDMFVEENPYCPLCGQLVS